MSKPIQEPKRLWKAIYVENQEQADQIDRLLHNTRILQGSGFDFDQDWEKIEEEDEPVGPVCCICKVNWVNAENGFDTCLRCLNQR